jgi:mannose-6-phosphate isomerase-like protein (cupin superfamily)
MFSVEPVLRDTEEEGYVVNGQLDIWNGGHHFEVSAGDTFGLPVENFDGLTVAIQTLSSPG